MPLGSGWFVIKLVIKLPRLEAAAYETATGLKVGDHLETRGGVRAPLTAAGSVGKHGVTSHIPVNVCFGSKADVKRHPSRCLLSGVKRT